VDIRAYTVGPFQENTYVLRADGSERAIVIDPGDNGEQLLEAIEKLGATVEAILITHTDVDHVGAVAPLAKATGAPVYCPRLEVDRLADIMGHVPIDGIGPYEGYDADETVEGGETLDLAGLRIEVVATPGHTEGHVTYVFPDEGVIASGDVLFQGSVGRTDLPGGDHAALIRSIKTKLLPLGDDVLFLCGHGPASTIGEERAANPFLR